MWREGIKLFVNILLNKFQNFIFYVKNIYLVFNLLLTRIIIIWH